MMPATEAEFCQTARLLLDAVEDLRRLQRGELFVLSGPMAVYGVPSSPDPALWLQMRYAYSLLRKLRQLWPFLDSKARGRVFTKCARRRAA